MIPITQKTSGKIEVHNISFFGSKQKMEKKNLNIVARKFALAKCSKPSRKIRNPVKAAYQV